MSDTVLALNAGSSSLKFGYYSLQHGNAPRELAHGQLEGKDGVTISARSVKGTQNVSLPLRADDGARLEELIAWLADTFDAPVPCSIGHRVVHGGPDFAGPAVITPDVRTAIDRLTPLAPLHQPPALALIDAASAICPRAQQVACFDTSFHHHLTPPVSRYGIPRAWEEKGLRRYGFHGLSYESIVSQLPEQHERRMVVAHLGSGASLCAITKGRSCDTTMGFSALDGLVMSTRPGAIDPGILLYMLRHDGMNVAELEEALYRESGLKGVSGLSGDVQELVESDRKDAAEAIQLFTFRIAREVAAMTNTLQGIDTLVFTGGVGENAPEIRTAVCQRLAWLGTEIDEVENRNNATRLSPDTSPVDVLLVKTDEEQVIAAHTAKLTA
ncbi:acetate kinase [Devosia pacifica]|uniref:Acetate kinase n=1 Tax=Devosia pacifica TaxID=1335967 RepID=A0A918VVA8_9HYPH|nr:acetate/propionate family kinase [Devosia pacifica]GHA32730.1 acetate kinase [Devosia pacifica]